MKVMTDELRSETRIRCQLKARIKLLDKPTGELPSRPSISCITSDVSINGVRMAFLTTRIVPVGATVSIRISTGILRRPFTHIGIVRWARRDPASPANAIGVELTDSTDSQMHRWMQYVQRVARSRGVVLSRDPELAEGSEAPREGDGEEEKQHADS